MSAAAPASNDTSEGERRRLLQPQKTGSSAGVASSTGGATDNSEVEKTEKQKYLELSEKHLDLSKKHLGLSKRHVG